MRSEVGPDGIWAGSRPTLATRPPPCRVTSAPGNRSKAIGQQRETSASLLWRSELASGDAAAGRCTSSDLLCSTRWQSLPCAPLSFRAAQAQPAAKFPLRLAEKPSIMPLFRTEIDWPRRLIASETRDGPAAPPPTRLDQFRSHLPIRFSPVQRGAACGPSGCATRYFS